MFKTSIWSDDSSALSYSSSPLSSGGRPCASSMSPTTSLTAHLPISLTQAWLCRRPASLLPELLAASSSPPCPVMTSGTCPGQNTCHTELNMTLLCPAFPLDWKVVGGRACFPFSLRPQKRRPGACWNTGYHGNEGCEKRAMAAERNKTELGERAERREGLTSTFACFRIVISVASAYPHPHPSALSRNSDSC